jgi:hypothetical protein
MVSSRTKTALTALAATALVALSQLGRTDPAEPSIRRRLSEDTSVVTTISLIGERHSGTNWITDHLAECFGSDLTVRLLIELCSLNCSS